jgi:hypothetical protein
MRGKIFSKLGGLLGVAGLVACATGGAGEEDPTGRFWRQREALGARGSLASGGPRGGHGGGGLGPPVRGAGGARGGGGAPGGRQGEPRREGAGPAAPRADRHRAGGAGAADRGHRGAGGVPLPAAGERGAGDGASIGAGGAGAAPRGAAAGHGDDPRAAAEVGGAVHRRLQGVVGAGGDDSRAGHPDRHRRHGDRLPPRGLRRPGDPGGVQGEQPDDHRARDLPHREGAGRGGFRRRVLRRLPVRQRAHPRR